MQKYLQRKQSTPSIQFILTPRVKEKKEVKFSSRPESLGTTRGEMEKNMDELLGGDDPVTHHLKQLTDGPHGMGPIRERLEQLREMVARLRYYGLELERIHRTRPAP